MAAWTGSKWRAVLLDLLERAGWSAGQAFFATLLAGGTTITVGNLPWMYALTLAVSAAVSSVVLTIVQYLTKLQNLPFWQDLVARLAKTFLSSLAGSFAAGVFDVTTFDWSTALNVAAVTTLAAFGKGMLAREAVVPAPTTTAPEPTAPAPTEAVAAAVRWTSPSTLPLSTYALATRT
jgi:hypothetical protein